MSRPRCSAPEPVTSTRSVSSRAVPARAAAALLPDARLADRRRGRAAGDAARGLARPGRLRGPGVAADVAVPDRDQPLPQRAARRRPADPARAGAAVPAAGAEPPRRGDLAAAVPGRAAGARARRRAGPGGALRDAGRRSNWRSSPRCSGCRRARPPPWCCATCSATPPPRSPACWTPPRPPSRAPCSGPAPRSTHRRRRPARPRPGRPGTRPGPALRRRVQRRRRRRGSSRLLTDDAWLAMPPAPHEYHGARRSPRSCAASAAWRGPAGACGSRRPAPTGQPAFGCYLAEPGDHAGRPPG